MGEKQNRGFITIAGKAIELPSNIIIETLEKELCPDCKGAVLIPASGCSFCPSCGYSPCK